MLGQPGARGVPRDVRRVRVRRPARMTVEEPLSGIVGVGLRKAVGIILRRDLLPTIQIERYFREGCCRDLQRLVDLAYLSGVSRVLNKDSYC